MAKYKLDIYRLDEILARYILEGELGAFTKGTLVNYYAQGYATKMGVWGDSMAEKFFQWYAEQPTSSSATNLDSTVLKFINSKCEGPKCWCGANAAGQGGIH